MGIERATGMRNGNGEGGRVPGAEFRVPGADCRVPSADCQLEWGRGRVSGAEFRVPGADCRVPSAECRLPSEDSHSNFSHFHQQPFRIKHSS